MIPIATKGTSGDGPEGRRRVLYILNGWEIVLFKEDTKAYVVHSCKAEAQHTKATIVDDPAAGPRRATTSASTLEEGILQGIQCWSCKAVVPDEIITITELFNG